MSSRKAIERMIEKAEQEKADMAKQIELKNAYIQGLRDTIRFLPKGAEKSDRLPILRPGSEIAKAHAILVTEGKPIHITELLKRMGKEVNKQNRASLSGYMGSFVRDGQYFTRPAPNTFAALESGEDSEETGPPASFGKE